ncbi:MAG: hypothetical protein ACKV2O_18955 [Acidimicrobiales bacterium]
MFLLLFLLLFLLPVGRYDTAGGAATERAEGEGPFTTVHLVQDSDPGSIPLVKGLEEGEVVVVRADGFAANTTGWIRLCVVEEPNRCGTTFPIRFDEGRSAIVQYQLQPAAPGEPGGCRPGSRCVLEVFDRHGGGYADLSFGPADPADVRLRLPGGSHVVVGQPFEVIVDGSLPADPLTVVLCQRADPFPRSCQPLSMADPTAPIGGPAGLRFEVIATPDQARDCHEGCVLSVRAGDEAIRADVIEVRPSSDTPVRYEPARLIAGLATAALMVGLAGWLWRRTDWSPPRAADGAAIDEADFADLDAEAAVSIERATEPADLGATQGHPRR